VTALKSVPERSGSQESAAVDTIGKLR